MNTIIVNTGHIILNGREMSTNGLSGMEMLTGMYKSLGVSYPKYYKMDPLCRVGFIAAEILLGPLKDNIDADHHAVVLMGRAGSLANDRKYQATIGEMPESYFPSPAVFVYTLANIVTGEIAIRHKIYGETSSYLIDSYNPELITTLLLTAFDDSGINIVTGGWIDCEDNDNFTCRMVTIDRNDKESEIKEFFENI